MRPATDVLFRLHSKNIRIFTNILWQVFHTPIFSARVRWAPGFIIPSTHGYKRIRNRLRVEIWKARHKIFADIRIFSQCTGATESEQCI